MGAETNQAGALMDALRDFVRRSVAPLIERLQAIEARPPLPGPPGPPGVKGDDGDEGPQGRDAFAVDVLESIDADRRYQRGTFAQYRGGLVRAYRPTDPVAPDADRDALDKSGWVVVLDGVAEQTIVQADDLRTFTFRSVRTSGAVVEQAFRLPVTIYRGAWKDDRQYDVGDQTTRDGTQWIALAPVAMGEAPGKSEGWRMAVKKGVNGTDGISIKGPPGPPGPPGRDLTQMAPNGAKW